LKRVMPVAFSMLLLCSLLFVVNVGTTKASEPGYVITEAYQAGGVTLDGTWGAGEWDGAGWIEYLDPYDARFAYKMDASDGVNYIMSWLIEFPDDTDNATDMWQICIDGAADGGTAPNANDVKIEIEGHTTLKVYVGDGQGWTDLETTAVTWAESLTTTSSWSPYNETHYVVEVKADKAALGSWGGNPPPHGLRVAMYDANNETQGWIAWPPTDPDIPDTWGLIDEGVATIPESFGIVVVVMLSSVAVAVSFFFLRNQLKSRSLSSREVSRTL
jgi:hypothetical protein